MVVSVDDRRVFERIMARFPTKFKHTRNGYGTDVFLRDISAEGAKIISKEELSVDDKIDLLVDLPDKHEPVRLRGRVIWAKTVGANTWDAGVAFEKINFMKTQRIFKFCQ